MEIYQIKQCAENSSRFYEYDLNVCIQHKILNVKLSIRKNKKTYFATLKIYH